MVRQARHHRGDHGAHRDARRRQPPDHLQPPGGRGAARLHPAAEARVKRGDRNPHPQQPLGRHRRQNIDVAFDQRALGGDRHRMAMGPKHLQHLAHQAMIGLNRLIGVGVGADGHRRHLIAFRPQLLRQHFRDAGPSDQPGFKIQSR